MPREAAVAPQSYVGGHVHAARPARSRRSTLATLWASTSASRRRVSGLAEPRAAASSTTCTRPARSTPATIRLGRGIGFPTTSGTPDVDPPGGIQLQPGRWFRDPPRYRRLSAVSSVHGRARATAPMVRRYASSAPTSNVQTDVTNNLLNRDFDLTVFEIELHSQDTFVGDGAPIITSAGTNFRSAPGSRCRPAATTLHALSALQATTANRRMLAVSPTVESGGFYSGTARRLARSTSRLRARPGVIVYPIDRAEQGRSAGGRFTTRLYRRSCRSAVQPVDCAGQQRPVRHA